MTCDHSRERPLCALDPDIGDEVRLKSDRDKVYVVTGVINERNSREIGGPGSIRVRYRVRYVGGYDTFEREVGLAEIAFDPSNSVPVPQDAGPAMAIPALAIMPDAMLDSDDVLDHLHKPSADPFATIEQATITTEDAIAWERSSPLGETMSRDGRFFIHRQGSAFRAFDTETIGKSDLVGTPAEAVAWCEDRTKPAAVAPEVPPAKSPDDDFPF